ncbi:MAG: hypothetical protein P8H92_15775 [Paracoccaceae bacterium]|nr:hypothetical protein [Paracoccaceae bacterium]
MKSTLGKARSIIGDACKKRSFRRGCTAYIGLKYPRRQKLEEPLTLHVYKWITLYRRSKKRPDQHCDSLGLLAPHPFLTPPDQERETPQTCRKSRYLQQKQCTAFSRFSLARETAIANFRIGMAYNPKPIQPNWFGAYPTPLFKLTQSHLSARIPSNLLNFQFDSSLPLATDSGHWICSGISKK